jgi:hypothetical protein
VVNVRLEERKQVVKKFSPSHSDVQILGVAQTFLSTVTFSYIGQRKYLIARTNNLINKIIQIVAEIQFLSSFTHCTYNLV